MYTLYKELITIGDYIIRTQRNKTHCLRTGDGRNDNRMHGNRCLETVYNRYSIHHAHVVLLERKIHNIDFLNAVVEACDSSPCQNGAECRKTATGYTCRCHNHFSGAHCEKGNNCTAVL